MYVVKNTFVEAVPQAPPPTIALRCVSAPVKGNQSKIVDDWSDDEETPTILGGAAGCGRRGGAFGLEAVREPSSASSDTAPASPLGESNADPIHKTPEQPGPPKPKPSSPAEPSPEPAPHHAWHVPVVMHPGPGMPPVPMVPVNPGWHGVPAWQPTAVNACMMEQHQQQQMAQFAWHEGILAAQRDEVNRLESRLRDLQKAPPPREAPAQRRSKRDNARGKSAIAALPPGLARQDSPATSTQRIRWAIDARRVLGKELVVTSPAFSLHGSSFKLLLQPASAGAARRKGRATFAASNGRISVSLKNEHTTGPKLAIRFLMADDAPRGPVTHDFGESPVAKLSTAFDAKRACGGMLVVGIEACPPWACAEATS